MCKISLIFPTVDFILNYFHRTTGSTFSGKTISRGSSIITSPKSPSFTSFRNKNLYENRVIKLITHFPDPNVLLLIFYNLSTNFFFPLLWTTFAKILHVSTKITISFTHDLVLWTSFRHNPLNHVDNFY